MLPYNLYRYTGDVSFLRDNADAIWKYLGFLKSIRKADNTVEYGLGDWCQIGAIRDSDYWTPVAVTDTLSALDICAKAEKIFGILGLADRAKGPPPCGRNSARRYAITLWNGNTGTCPSAVRIVLRRQRRQCSSVTAYIRGKNCRTPFFG